MSAHEMAAVATKADEQIYFAERVKLFLLSSPSFLEWGEGNIMHEQW